jgi:hypothetical protein
MVSQCLQMWGYMAQKKNGCKYGYHKDLGLHGDMVVEWRAYIRLPSHNAIFVHDEEDGVGLDME